jgi:HK97 family phage major capsid protein
MPWMIVEHENSYCVHEENADGSPGARVKCYETRQDAENYMSALYANAGEEAERRSIDQPIAFGGSVKALDETGRVGGYLVSFGSAEDRDLTGEYFDAETDFMIADYTVTGERTLYHHGLDGTLKAQVVGKIISHRMDDWGIWIEAQLDMAKEYAQAVYELVKRGVLGWSSGALPQAVDVDYETGHIKRWPIIEASLTPSPAQPEKTKITTLKSLIEHGCSFEVIGPAAVKEPGESTAASADDEGVLSSGSSKAALSTETNTVSQTDVRDEETKMDPEELAAAVAAAKEGADEVPDDDEEEKSTRAEMDDASLQAIVESVAAQLGAQLDEEQFAALLDVARNAVAALEPEMEMKEQAKAVGKAVAELLKRFVLRPQTADKPQRKSAPFNGGGRRQPNIQVFSKYHHMSDEDMSYYAWWQGEMRRVNNQPAKSLSPEFYRELADKAQKSYGANRAWLDRTAVKAIQAIKADELNHSTQANAGDEWVPDHWSNQLWEKARQDNVIFPLFQAIDMPTDPYELPIEYTDPTVYYVPETTDETHLSLGSGNPIPDSKVGTGKVQLDSKKLGLRVGISEETNEDSVIPFIPQARQQSIRAMEDAVDNVLLNGDTTNAGTGNINSDDADPADTQKYLIFDGLRHAALVDNSAANASDAGNVAPNISRLRAVRFLLPAALATRPQDLAWIVDGSTYGKMLSMDEVVTVDKFGPNATILTGQIGMVDGIPVFVSAEMGLTEADGKISATPSNNTRGQALIAFRPNHKVGFRRRVKAVVEYISYYDSYQMTVTLRIAFARLTVGSDYSAAVGYNFAV